ncbi:hypothetical protein Vafri_8206, partial [Volvox africanus]
MWIILTRKRAVTQLYNVKINRIIQWMLHSQKLYVFLPLKVINQAAMRGTFLHRGCKGGLRGSASAVADVLAAPVRAAAGGAEDDTSPELLHSVDGPSDMGCRQGAEKLHAGRCSSVLLLGAADEVISSSLPDAVQHSSSRKLSAAAETCWSSPLAPSTLPGINRVGVLALEPPRELRSGPTASQSSTACTDNCLPLPLPATASSLDARSSGLLCRGQCLLADGPSINTHNPPGPFLVGAAGRAAMASAAYSEPQRASSSSAASTSASEAAHQSYVVLANSGVGGNGASRPLPPPPFTKISRGPSSSQPPVEYGLGPSPSDSNSSSGSSLNPGGQHHHPAQRQPAEVQSGAEDPDRLAALLGDEPLPEPVPPAAWLPTRPAATFPSQRLDTDTEADDTVAMRGAANDFGDLIPQPQSVVEHQGLIIGSDSIGLPRLRDVYDVVDVGSSGQSARTGLDLDLDLGLAGDIGAGAGGEEIDAATRMPAQGPSAVKLDSSRAHALSRVALKSLAMHHAFRLRLQGSAAAGPAAAVQRQLAPVPTDVSLAASVEAMTTRRNRPRLGPAVSRSPTASVVPTELRQEPDATRTAAPSRDAVDRLAAEVEESIAAVTAPTSARGQGLAALAATSRSSNFGALKGLALARLGARPSYLPPQQQQGKAQEDPQGAREAQDLELLRPVAGRFPQLAPSSTEEAAMALAAAERLARISSMRKQRRQQQLLHQMEQVPPSAALQMQNATAAATARQEAAAAAPAPAAATVAASPSASRLDGEQRQMAMEGTAASDAAAASRTSTPAESRGGFGIAAERVAAAAPLSFSRPPPPAAAPPPLQPSEPQSPSAQAASYKLVARTSSAGGTPDVTWSVTAYPHDAANTTTAAATTLPRYCDESLTHAAPEDEPYLGDRDAALQATTEAHAKSWRGGLSLLRLAMSRMNLGTLRQRVMAAWPQLQPQPGSAGATHSANAAPFEAQPPSRVLEGDAAQTNAPLSTVGELFISPPQPQPPQPPPAEPRATSELTAVAAKPFLSGVAAPPTDTSAVATSSGGDLRLDRSSWVDTLLSIWRSSSQRAGGSSPGGVTIAMAEANHVTAAEMRRATEAEEGGGAVAELWARLPTESVMPAAPAPAEAEAEAAILKVMQPDPDVFLDRTAVAAPPSALPVIETVVEGREKAATAAATASDSHREQLEALISTPEAAAAAAAALTTAATAAAAAKGSRGLLDLIRSPQAAEAAAKFAHVRASLE